MLLIGMHRHHQADAAEHLRPEQLPEVPVLGQVQVIHQVPTAKNRKPADQHARAGRRLRISRPAIGAVRNMATPETNMVSPIISAS